MEHKQDNWPELTNTIWLPYLTASWSAVELKERKMGECIRFLHLTSQVTVTYAEALPKTGSKSACQHKALNICFFLYAQLYLTYLNCCYFNPWIYLFLPFQFFLLHSTDRVGTSDWVRSYLLTMVNPPRPGKTILWWFLSNEASNFWAWWDKSQNTTYMKSWQVQKIKITVICFLVIETTRQCCWA